jgi:hypothetical protein
MVLPTGPLEEVRTAHFFHRTSRASPWSGVQGVDSPRRGLGQRPSGSASGGY